MDPFNSEFEKYVAFGALVELTSSDMDSWSGPVHYVLLQHVLKPGSTTTPLRIFTNSSLADRIGNSVNSILMKSPNSVVYQREVMSRYRCYKQGLSSDITKAYFTMRTGELEMHVRRVVWRYGDSSAKWRHFGYRTVSFGYKPAGTFLDIVINKTAHRSDDIDQQASLKIINDRYVDDIATGGSAQEVQVMSGECVNPHDKFETNGTLSQILSKGTLKLKAIVTSEEKDTEKINKLGYVLGVKWDSPLDRIMQPLNTYCHQISTILESLVFCLVSSTNHTTCRD